MDTTFFSSAALEFKPWSPSKLGVLDSCSQKFINQYVEKPKLKADEFVVTDDTPLVLGSAAHKYAELMQGGDASKVAKERAFREVPKTVKNKVKLKGLIRSIDSFHERMESFKSRNNVVLDKSELRLAVLPNMELCDFWDNKSILRGVLDRVLVVSKGGKNHAIAIDIKTGRCKSVGSYSIQLESYGILLHSRFDIASVQPAIYSTTSGDLTWYPKKILPTDISASNPVVKYINKVSSKVEEGFSPEKGRHCTWCNFKTLCEKENTGYDGSVPF